MISFCTLIRDVPHLDKLIDMFKRNCPTDYEICIGDNSTYRVNREKARKLADVYVRITDKELWRMGIPWGHNRIVAEANSYKIFYVDSDEYPVWIHPDIEDHYDLSYVLNCLRVDFLDMDEIMEVDSKKYDLSKLSEILKGRGYTALHQERLYNSRYAKFEGVCHSIFHVPEHVRRTQASAVLLHNRTVRDAKDIDRMRTIIREQYARMNINPALASSETVLGWGKQFGHAFKDFDDFINNYNGYPYSDM